jgi:hypothetical protein
MFTMSTYPAWVAGSPRRGTVAEKVRSRDDPCVSGDDVRRIALSFPEAREQETWGHPTFRVRDKMFATMATDGTSASLKASREAQAALVGSEPETFSVAPYVGQHGWVTVDLRRVDPEEMAELLDEAWRATAPKRVVAAYDGSR